MFNIENIKMYNRNYMKIHFFFFKKKSFANFWETVIYEQLKHNKFIINKEKSIIGFQM